jgi:hypothetical protein
MNLLISLNSIFYDKESLGREELEVAGLEEDLEAAGLKETPDKGQDSKEEEGHKEGAGLDDEW